MGELHDVLQPTLFSPSVQEPLPRARSRCGEALTTQCTAGDTTSGTLDIRGGPS